MNIAEALKYVIRDPERKPLARVAVEATHCALIEREIPLYYFTSLLHQKDAGDYRQFIGHRRLHRIHDGFFHSGGDYSNLEDKRAFADVLGTNGVPTPAFVAHSTGRRVDAQGEAITVESAEQLFDVIQRLVSMSRTGKVFVKPVDGMGGKNSYRFPSDASQAAANELFHLMQDHHFLFQEYVVQHPDVNAVYDKSINTVRVHSYLDQDTGQVEIISALMRFGSGGNIVDNGSSSGFFVPVDTDSWQLRGNGKSYLHSGGRTLVRHPDSGVKLDGFQIPYGEQIEAVVRDAAPLFEKPFIGWDIALTNDGPTVIEGNQNPHLIMAQVASGGIKNHPGFRKVLKDYL